MKNWQELSATSHFLTAVAVEDALQRGDIAEATDGIQELIDALSRSDKRALRSQLIHLMTHIIKWKTQPDKRSRSWRSTIRYARQEIADIQEETPRLSRKVIEEKWDRCFERAMDDAEDEMGERPAVANLSWKDIF